jgi:hypothetical protein
VRFHAAWSRLRGIGDHIGAAISSRRIVTIDIGETTLREFDDRGDTLINQTPRTSTKALARR